MFSSLTRWLLAVCFCAVFCTDAHANILRDAEIEETLYGWIKPLAQAGGIDHTGIRLVLVQDDSINAFVAQGDHLFINSGLLTSSQSADEVKGVIAHELGHLAGGHLLRMDNIRENSAWLNALSVLLGAAAMASGQSDVGLAALTALPHASSRLFLSELRHNEYLADQAAVSYLQGTGQSVEGLYAFMQRLSLEDIMQDLDISPAGTLTLGG